MDIKTTKSLPVTWLKINLNEQSLPQDTICIIVRKNYDKTTETLTPIELKISVSFIVTMWQFDNMPLTWACCFDVLFQKKKITLNIHNF